MARKILISSRTNENPAQYFARNNSFIFFESLNIKQNSSLDTEVEY